MRRSLFALQTRIRSYWSNVSKISFWAQWRCKQETLMVHLPQGGNSMESPAARSTGTTTRMTRACVGVRAWSLCATPGRCARLSLRGARRRQRSSVTSSAWCPTAPTNAGRCPTPANDGLVAGALGRKLRTDYANRARQAVEDHASARVCTFSGIASSLGPWSHIVSIRMGPATSVGVEESFCKAAPGVMRVSLVS